MLAEVDEREAEHRGIAPAQQRRRRAGSSSTCAAITEVAKWREGIAASGFPPRKPYRGGPEATPDPLAHVDHDPPHTRRIRPCSAAHHGRRRRDREVPDQAEVEDRADHRRRPREALRMPPQDPGRRRMRLQEPGPVQRRRARSRAAAARPGRASARCSTTVGGRAEERAIERDRVVDQHPPLEPLRVVVGELVHDDVGPHLQGVDGDVALRACAARRSRCRAAPRRPRPRDRGRAGAAVGGASGSAMPAQTRPSASTQSGRPRRRRPEALRRRRDLPHGRCMAAGGDRDVHRGRPRGQKGRGHRCRGLHRPGALRAPRLGGGARARARRRRVLRRAGRGCGRDFRRCDTTDAARRSRRSRAPSWSSMPLRA